MTVPPGLHYTPEHEWVAIDGSIASVGITDHAQRALGDVVYVSMPAAGSAVTAGEPCGEVPGLVNADPYGAGWLFRVRLATADGQLPPGLLAPADYAELTKDTE